MASEPTREAPSEQELERLRDMFERYPDVASLRESGLALLDAYERLTAQPAAAEASDREAAVLVVTNEWDNYALAEAVRWARTGERSTVITADFVREVEQLEPHFKRHRAAHAQGAASDSAGADVLRASMRKLLEALESDSLGAEDLEAARCDYHAARMLVGRADGDWDPDAAKIGLKRIGVES